jgi:mannose-6-phosphate isomerase-like protein (cupin superfamily)
MLHSALAVVPSAPEQTLRDGLDIAHKVCIENIEETEAKEPCPKIVAFSAQASLSTKGPKAQGCRPWKRQDRLGRRVDKFMCPGARLALVTSASRSYLHSRLCSQYSHVLVSRPDLSSQREPNDNADTIKCRRRPNEKGVAMKGFVQDIEGLAIKNDEFRRVVYTASHCQLVVMALKPKEEIGAEVHKLDQFFRVEEGSGEAVLNGVRTAIRAGFAVLVPAGTNHNIINTGTAPMKLYTLYAPPNHRDGVVHHTRHEAEADNEHFDGKTTE